ncbi:hypothetical protein L5G32_17895 [Gordonia sp. HY002]|nr:hypothetical protein [Gordonia zhenghanii]MCF8604280.1 hypothetical protein [Gordonia zhenghanii]
MRAATANCTTVTKILGRNQLSRSASDYEAILHLATLTRQPVSRISMMTLDDCHSRVRAKEGWLARNWGQHCRCAPIGVTRREWALALSPVCFHCGHLIGMPGSGIIQLPRAPDRILSVCKEVSSAAHRSVNDYDALDRLECLRVELPSVARRLSRGSTHWDPSITELVTTATADLAMSRESEEELPRSPAVRALAITMAWEEQRAWVTPRIAPHPRPTPVRAASSEIPDTQVFTRQVLRTGAKTVKTMQLPTSSVRHPRGEDLIRLVLGHTQLTLDHIPGIYRIEGEPLVLEPAQWLWRSRVALLLSQCVRLRDEWSIADEPTYRLTKAGSYSIYTGAWPKWTPIFYRESDTAHAMNLARALCLDDLVNYRKRRDVLRPIEAVPLALADTLPAAARNFDGCARLAASWMWFDATCDSPRAPLAAEHLKAFDAALNPEGRLVLRTAADALCDADEDLVRRVGRPQSSGVAPDGVREERRTRVGA